MSIENNPYINIGNQIYDNRAPAFYDTIDDNTLIKIVESNATTFFKEWQQYVQQQEKRTKFFLLYKEKGWDTIMLYSYGLRYHKNCLHFPETLKLIAPFGNMVTLYFSTLNADTKIKPHYGDTDATYRIHLGLKIPAELPTCGIEVGGIQKSWIENKTLIFNDAHYHTAWNLSNENRTVLIIDILKPDYIQQKKWILPQILGALGMGRLFFFLREVKLPKIVIKSLHFIATIIFKMFIPFQRALHIFYK